jgi:hypothetical protein
MIINSLTGFTHFGDSDEKFKLVCCAKETIEFRFHKGWSPVGPSTICFAFEFLGAKDPVEIIEYTKRR